MTAANPVQSTQKPGDADSKESLIEVRDVTLAYGNFVVQRDLNFAVHQGEIVVIMGGSGCGKSTLLKHMIGLRDPAKGDILYHGESFVHATKNRRQEMMRQFGVLFQGGALWSSMTLRENVGLPLEEYTDLRPREISEIAAVKLALVGLSGFEEFYPSEISGGMRKRAALARAIALDPEILYFDEPSAGLDPISSRRLDDLILEIRDSLGATIVIVTHELASIFAVADTSVFLDAKTRTMTAHGDPRELRDHSDDEAVRTFLLRGENPEDQGKNDGDNR